MKDLIKQEKIFTIPNILSVFRIVLAPVFAYFYFSDMQNHYVWATVILLVSGATDILDGVIARKFNLITTLGKILDPIADKLTQAFIIVCLFINHYNDKDSLLVYVVILLFAKEFTMLLGAIVLFKSGTRTSSSKWWGKLGTVLVYFLFVCVLLQDIFTAKFVPVQAINVVAIITAICLVFSLFNYYDVFKEIQNGEYSFEDENK